MNNLGYDEMVEFLDSPETRAFVDEIYKTVMPLDLCGLCKGRMGIPPSYYLERLSKQDLRSRYVYVKSLLANIGLRPE